MLLYKKLLLMTFGTTLVNCNTGHMHRNLMSLPIFDQCTSEYGGRVFSGRGKSIPLQAGAGPDDPRSLRLLEFRDNQHMKVARC